MRDAARPASVRAVPEIALKSWPVSVSADMLASADVLVMEAALDRNAAGAAASLTTLSTAERERYAQYSNPRIANRFAVGRSMVRQALADVHGIAGCAVSLAFGKYGKPYMADSAGAPLPTWFSIAHSGDLVVLALSARAAVGIDIERVRRIPYWSEIAAAVFPASVVAALHDEINRGVDASVAFLRRWCRLEARLKMTGLGLQGIGQPAEGSDDSAESFFEVDAYCVPSVFAREPKSYLVCVAHAKYGDPIGIQGGLEW
jgi:phosphopantetheinyl transferase